MNRRDLIIGAAGAAGAMAAGCVSGQTGSAGAVAAARGSSWDALPDAVTGRGFNAPLRFNASIDDCEVVGQVPSDLDGAFYRLGGEFYYPPLFPDDAPLSADGYISMFRFKDGVVDFRGRWVETRRFKMQRQERRSLYGYYRNPYTDDPLVRDPTRPNLRTAANTAPVVHAGKLFATKEDGLPHRIDPNTLETVGPFDFDGAWRSQTFTAHPKLDPVTGDMIAYGYEAEGLATNALWIYRIDRDGAVRQEVRATVPYVSVIHDMALTQRRIVIPFAGYVTSEERLRDGQIHWGWDKTKPSCIGVLPRDGEASDMRWFYGPSRCMMHTFNAHDEGEKVVLYAPFWDGNFFPFFPNVDGSPFQPELARAFIRKITLDLSSSDDAWTEEILWPMDVVDLGKTDPRATSLETRYLYTSYADPTLPFARNQVRAGAPGRIVNSYGRFDLATGALDQYFAGPTHSLQEVTFAPRRGGQREGDGYLMGVASNYAEDRTELVIADAERLGEGDVARVILPFKLSSQVHGVWASADELPLV